MVKKNNESHSAWDSNPQPPDRTSFRSLARYHCASRARIGCKNRPATCASNRRSNFACWVNEENCETTRHGVGETCSRLWICADLSLSLARISSDGGSEVGARNVWFPFDQATCSSGRITNFLVVRLLSFDKFGMNVSIVALYVSLRWDRGADARRSAAVI